MSHLLNRRHLIGGNALAPFAAATLPSLARATRLQSGDRARLGESIDAFEADLGRSTAASREFDVVQFGEPDAGEIVHYVRFTDSHADHIEVDLTFLREGGLPEEEMNVGDSRFLPGDAIPLATASGGNLQFEHEAYDFRTWHSPSLASDTGRTGNILVMDAHGEAGDGMTAAPPYTRATISMESFEIQPVTPSGKAAVLGAPLEAWVAAYGAGIHHSEQRMSRTRHTSGCTWAPTMSSAAYQK
jgi:hypothetical protein